MFFLYIAYYSLTLIYKSLVTLVPFLTLHFFRNEVAQYRMKYEQYVSIFSFFFIFSSGNCTVIWSNTLYNIHMCCFKYIVNCKCKIKSKFLYLLFNETHEQYITLWIRTVHFDIHYLFIFVAITMELFSLTPRMISICVV